MFEKPRIGEIDTGSGNKLILCSELNQLAKKYNIGQKSMFGISPFVIHSIKILVCDIWSFAYVDKGLSDTTNFSHI